MNLPWVCEARADMSEDTVKMMADGGCRAILFGIEATTNDDLAKLNKGITIEQVQKTISFCNKHGIKPVGMFILGFPWDTARSMKDRFKRARNMGLHNTSIGRLFMFPESEMYHQIIAENLAEYRYKDLIIPRTEDMSAWRVNWLYFNLLKRNYFIKKMIGL